MAITETSTAYTSQIKDVHVGNFVHAFEYTVVATISASAGAMTILGPRVQKNLYILAINGRHTSGADSMPVDIGIDASTSLFATQVTQGANVNPSTFKAGVFPYHSSVSDDAAALYQTVKFFAQAGTNTTGAIFKYAVTIAADPF